MIYCDVDIITDTRLLLKIYKKSFIGKYIWSDFNDNIINVSVGSDYIIPLIFGYKTIRYRDFYYNDDYQVSDLQTSKLYP